MDVDPKLQTNRVADLGRTVRPSSRAAGVALLVAGHVLPVGVERKGVAGALAQPFLVGATLDRIGLLDGKGLDLDQLAHHAHGLGPVALGLGSAQCEA